MCEKYEDSYDKYVLLATSGKIVLPDYLDKESKNLLKQLLRKINLLQKLLKNLYDTCK